MGGTGGFRAYGCGGHGDERVRVPARHQPAGERRRDPRRTAVRCRQPEDRLGKEHEFVLSHRLADQDDGRPAGGGRRARRQVSLGGPGAVDAGDGRRSPQAPQGRPHDRELLTVRRLQGVDDRVQQRMRRSDGPLPRLRRPGVEPASHEREGRLAGHEQHLVRQPYRTTRHRRQPRQLFFSDRPTAARAGDAEVRRDPRSDRSGLCPDRQR